MSLKLYGSAHYPYFALPQTTILLYDQLRHSSGHIGHWHGLLIICFYRFCSFALLLTFLPACRYSLQQDSAWRASSSKVVRLHNHIDRVQHSPDERNRNSLIGLTLKSNRSREFHELRMLIDSPHFCCLWWQRTVINLNLYFGKHMAFICRISEISRGPQQIPFINELDSGTWMVSQLHLVEFKRIPASCSHGLLCFKLSKYKFTAHWGSSHIYLQCMISISISISYIKLAECRRVFLFETSVWVIQLVWHSRRQRSSLQISMLITDVRCILQTRSLTFQGLWDVCVAM